MAPVGPLSLSRWHTRAIIGTDRPTKGRRTAPMPCWAKRSQHLGASARARQPASSNLRSRNSARAAQGRTALVAVAMAVTAMTVSPSDSTRRGRAHHHDGSKGVKIKVNLLAVRMMFNGDYAWNRLHGSGRHTHCARVWRGFARCCRVRAQEASPSPHGGRRLTGGVLRDVSGCSSRV